MRAGRHRVATEYRGVGERPAGGVGHGQGNEKGSCSSWNLGRRAARAVVRTGFVMMVGIGAWPVCGDEGSAREAAQEGVPSRALIEQKSKLLDSVLASPRVAQISAGRDGEGAVLIGQARRAAEEARNALSAGDLQRAAALLDQGIRACAMASSRLGRSAEEDAHLRARNQEILQEVMSYRESLGETVRASGGAREEAELERIDRMTARASEYTAANRPVEAGKLLREAHGLAVGLLSELRAGQTVHLNLRFDTPAEELAYERRSHDGNVALVRRMLREDRIPPERRQYVDRHLQESLEYRAQADELAGHGDYPAAIKLLEKANEQLLNAVMSASGVTSF